MQILRKILSDEIRVRSRANAMQAKLFGDELARCSLATRRRQLTSAEVIERLVELARKMREARAAATRRSASRSRRSPSTTPSPAARDDWIADPRLAEIAQALVQSVKEDLTVDWTSHESTEAAIRLKIKHLLRRYRFEAPGAGGSRRHGGSTRSPT